MSRQLRSVLRIMVLISAASSALAQLVPREIELGRARSLDEDNPYISRLLSNVIIDILPTGSADTLWLGTGTGVTRFLPRSSRFESYSEAEGLGKGGVSGLFVSDTAIFAAFAFDTSVGISGAGGGIAYSHDQGRSWKWFPQPRDRIYDLDDNGKDLVLGYFPTATNVDNITYDIALSDSFVWIVSKGGGLRRHLRQPANESAIYEDYNDTTGWKLVTPDTLVFRPVQVLNHRTFSCVYAEDALWVGTAGGINKTTDNGATWRNFSAGSSGISGNFVTAMGYQDATHTLWAATWRAEGPQEFYAVSKTSDGGNTWGVSLTEDQIEAAIGRSETPRVHSFAFDDSVVYACDDIGLWKSADGGESWGLFPEFVDSVDNHRFSEDEIYGALKAHGNLWAGGLDGLAGSASNGQHWRIYQTGVPLDDAQRPADTYAYPCPWSPNRFGPVKLRYATSGGRVEVKIFDFAMSEVVSLPSATRAPGEQYELWDGKKDGVIVANGTYFYKIDKPGGEVWGKLIVLD